MAIDGGNSIEVTILTLQNNKLCYCNLEYMPTGANASLDVQDCIEHIYTQIADPLTDALSAAVTWLSLDGRLRGTPNSGRTYSKSVNSAGQIAGDVLPVYVTYSFDKYPDNDNKYSPTNAPSFRNGRACLSGVPEAFQNNGALIGTYQGVLDTLAAALWTIPEDIFNGVPELRQVMTRYTAGQFVARARVDAFTFNRIGTQLTRKK